MLLITSIYFPVITPLLQKNGGNDIFPIPPRNMYAMYAFKQLTYTVLYSPFVLSWCTI